MFNEREFITKVEAAGPADFADLIRSPNVDEERALRTHFGETLFEELQQLAFVSTTRSQTQGNVVVLHGIMGSELAENGTRIWVDVFRLISGKFRRFKLDENGRSEADIRPQGLLKRYYGKQLLSLARRWRVRGFAYDWRLDIFESANRLATDIDIWFGGDEPVHLVAHSMGGLVARAFIARHPERWKKMWDASDNGRRGGRLIMLGTPNHGSFAIPHLYLGLNDTIRKLAALDVTSDLNTLLGTVQSFVGTYQMLPSELIDSSYSNFLNTAALRLPPELTGRLQLARESHRELASVVDPERMFYVAGCDHPTVAGVRDWVNLRQSSSYEITRDGDGTVPHSLGLLGSSSNGVRTYYVPEEHGRLPGNVDVLRATEALLEGRVNETGLSDTPLRQRGGDARAEWEAQQRLEQASFEMLAAGLKVRGGRVEPPQALSKNEQEVEALLLRDFAAERTAAAVMNAAAPGSTSESAIASTVTKALKPGSTPQPTPSIRVRVWHGSIADAGLVPEEGLAEIPIDALAVGHYTGVRPVNAELALDKAISAAFPAPPDGGTVLVQLSERQVLRGDLGQPFFLPDPRSNAVSRVIVVAGMGVPGRFAIPELKVLARELGWALGRIGKAHLATVLIGAGAGNLEIDAAVEGWLGGLRRALLESISAESARLRMVTFVEFSPARVIKLHAELQRASQEWRRRLILDVDPLADEDRLKQLAVDEKAAQSDARKPRDDQPSRLTVEIVGNTYVYGALTEAAAVPQRTVPVDSALVHEGVERLVAARSPGDQIEHGEYMQRLLVPTDFRGAMSGEAPLVIVCDNKTAQVPWEMLTQPAADGLMDASVPPQERYLGLRRALTRQLRTTFAPPPEPPPPARRTVRVLIVADPSAEHPLPGAREEGWTISELLARHNETRSQETGNVIEWKVLIGPGKATRTDVLKELLLRQYEVLHFAGHCEYNRENPGLSGWIFSDVTIDGKKRPGLLTANELQRIDRVPRLIIANACESGVLPERPELQSPAVAPTFAEAFFARGVADFVCTAWPVNDASAIAFASEFYKQLLGLVGPPQAICGAMREARRKAQEHPQGGGSWGAYQHYGNPNFRLFR